MSDVMATSPVTAAGGMPKRKHRRRRIAILDAIALGMVALIVTMAVIGPFIAPDVDRSAVTNALLPPSSEYWFGTDQQGRDVFWRVVVGARYSLFTAVVIVIGYGTVGVLIATSAVAAPRWLSEPITRFIDLGLAFPSIVFALGIAAALGPSLRTAVVALVLTGWPLTARLLQGIMKEVIALPFVEGARVLGVSPPRLMLRHVLPNALPALWVKWAGDVGNTVLALGALSFIGAGAQPPLPEWGAMVAGSQTVASSAWWTVMFPGLAIMLTTASFGLLGDMLHKRSESSFSHGRGEG